jgi:hypothetical protein
MWYVLHQQAAQIIEERQREADRIRLARLAETGETFVPGPSFASVVRHGAARATLVVGRQATRVARALDPDLVRT